MLQHIKKTLILALPLVVGQLGQMMMSVVDSIMVGHLGAASLAAASLGSGLFLIVLLFGTGITLAISPLVSHAFGDGKPKRCGQILRQGVLVALGAGGLLTLIAVWGSQVISFLGQNPEVEVLAIAYTKTLGWSVIPFMLFMTYKQFSEGLQHMIPAMVISILANGLNALGNWVFIFGNWGAPAFGLEGAGWATFTTRVVMALAMIAYVTFSSRYYKFKPGLHFRRVRWDLMRHILKVGIPSGVQYLFEASAFVASAFMIGWIGKNELAAHQIAMNLASITYMVSLGVSMASTVRIARFYGQGDFVGVKNAGTASFFLILGIMTVTGLLFSLTHEILPHLYINDPVVIGIAAKLILVAALFQLSDGQQAVCLGALRGLQDVSVPARLTFLAYWVFGIPFGWFLARGLGLGVIGIWLGLVMGLTASAGFLTLRFYKLLARMRVTRMGPSNLHVTKRK